MRYRTDCLLNWIYDRCMKKEDRFEGRLLEELAEFKCEVLRQINLIKHQGVSIMATLQDVNAALTQLAADVKALPTGVVTSTDLDNVVSSINAIDASVKAITPVTP